MRFVTNTLRDWRQDRLLRLVIKNSSYLFSSNMLSLGLSFLQGIFMARLLGLEGVAIVGVIQTFASTVNRLLSFRMGELVVRYFNRYLAENRPDRAGALVKAAALAEGITSLLAYGLLVALAPWAAVTFGKDINLAPLYIFYGLIIPANLMFETATGVLQVGGRFRSQAGLNLAQSLATALIIFAAFLFQADIAWVLGAYVVGKLMTGVGVVVLAWRRLDELLGRRWRRAPLSLLPNWRELGGFAFSTNLSGTINLIVRDSEMLWIAYFLSLADQGLYNRALAVVNLILIPINPLITSTFPEITRQAAQSAWGSLRSLLRRVTLLSGVFTLAAVVALVLLGRWVLWLYGPDFVPAYPTMLVLLIGFAAANILFWNRPLLIALGLPQFPLRVAFWAMVAKVVLSFIVIPRFGILGAAALLSGYLAFTVLAYVARGLAQVRRMERQAVPVEAVEMQP